MNTALIVIGVVAILALVAFLLGRSKAKEGQANKVAETKKRQAEIAARVPRTRKGRIDKLKKKGL